MPVEVDVPEYIVKLGLQPGSNEATKATGDSCLMAFYFLLRVGEYTIKGTRNESKQTVQFRVKDVTFFKKDAAGRLRQLPPNASEEDIMSADAATLRLENQKNGWKGVCISHHSNGMEAYDPVRAVARRYVHIRSHTRDADTFLSAYFQDGERKDVRDRDISAALKLAAGALDYPSRGIPIKRIDTHSLRIGGANALSLNGYSKHQIQKMGRWRGETFLEYIRESLSDFSEGMSSAMNKCFGVSRISRIGTWRVPGMENDMGEPRGRQHGLGARGARWIRLYGHTAMVQSFSGMTAMMPDTMETSNNVLEAQRSDATDGATDGVTNKQLHRRSFVSKQFS
eukprot:scaffold49904_cov49-Cyclotella_meneghiniana.AAC.1